MSLPLDLAQSAILDTLSNVQLIIFDNYPSTAVLSVAWNTSEHVLIAALIAVEMLLITDQEVKLLPISVLAFSSTLPRSFTPLSIA